MKGNQVDSALTNALSSDGDDPHDGFCTEVSVSGFSLVDRRERLDCEGMAVDSDFRGAGRTTHRNRVESRGEAAEGARAMASHESVDASVQIRTRGAHVTRAYRRTDETESDTRQSSGPSRAGSNLGSAPRGSEPVRIDGETITRHTRWLSATI